MATSVSADTLLYITFTATTYSQRPISDNGTNTVAAAPKVQSHNTAELLTTLAKDKAAQGNWSSNSFPAGAKLAAGNDSFVVTLGTNVLVDVSDILSFSNGEQEVFSGKTSDATGLATPSITRLRTGRLSFDDTGIVNGSGLKFYLQGVLTEKRTDSVPVNGTYTRSTSAKLSSGTGEGSSDGIPFILTGSLIATGHGKETLQ